MNDPVQYDTSLPDSMAKRLARLAANLQRIAVLTASPDSVHAIVGLIDASKSLFEQSALDLLPTRGADAAYVRNVRDELDRWKSTWDQVHTDPLQRQKLAEQAREWSVEILYMSGLVDE